MNSKLLQLLPVIGFIVSLLGVVDLSYNISGILLLMVLMAASLIFFLVSCFKSRKMIISSVTTIVMVVVGIAVGIEVAHSQKLETFEKAKKTISQIEDYQAKHGDYPVALSMLGDTPDTCMGLLFRIPFQYYPKKDGFALTFKDIMWGQQAYLSKDKLWVSED